MSDWQWCHLRLACASWSKPRLPSIPKRAHPVIPSKTRLQQIDILNSGWYCETLKNTEKIMKSGDFPYLQLPFRGFFCVKFSNNMYEGSPYYPNPTPRPRPLHTFRPPASSPNISWTAVVRSDASPVKVAGKSQGDDQVITINIVGNPIK